MQVCTCDADEGWRLSPSTARTVTSCLSHRLTSRAPIIDTLLASVPALKTMTAMTTVTDRCRAANQPTWVPVSRGMLPRGMLLQSGIQQCGTSPMPVPPLKRHVQHFPLAQASAANQAQVAYQASLDEQAESMLAQPS